MKRYRITTLGCKVNQYESETLEQQLRSHGFTPAKNAEAADVCVINTCTVTRKASMQSRQAVRQARRTNPGARILVTGCYAQTAPEEIRAIDGVDAIVGNTGKKNILSDVLLNSDTGAVKKPVTLPSEDEPWPALSPDLKCVHRTRPFIKIQDGCNAFCTYCIVPYSRGRSRSMPPERVLDTVRAFFNAGFHEVVLTGIHMGVYGRDLRPSSSLHELLRQIDSLENGGRVRLSSIEPCELTEDIISLASGSPGICHHFHMPLQSGDDGVLKKMHRPYTGSEFRDIILKVREALPDAAIGADVLIGFPGETDEAFENTRSLIASLPLSYLHVFPFSPREGTPASRFSEQVPPDVSQERCRIIRELGNLKRGKFYRKFVGRTVSVLIEGKRDLSTGLLKGLSSNYIPVHVTGEDHLRNRLVDVLIESVDERNFVTGRVLSGDEISKD